MNKITNELNLIFLIFINIKISVIKFKIFNQNVYKLLLRIYINIKSKKQKIS